MIADEVSTVMENDGIKFRGCLEKSGDSDDDQNDHTSPTYIVIQFAPKVKIETAKWIVQKIISAKNVGGADLTVKQQPRLNNDIGLILHVSANHFKLLELAEELDIRKRDRKGSIRDFTMSAMDDFINLQSSDCSSDILSTAEKQSLVRHELENIRALENENSVPGYTNIHLYEGQSILMACLHWRLILQIFPLHDEEEVKKLGKLWFMSLFSKQPFESIRGYFGESVALYFQFLDYYTTFLLVPMIFGFYQMFMTTEAIAFFCIFNVLSASVFLEMWRRKCSELAYLWGTIGMASSMDEPRPNFRGTMAIDVVTGKKQPQFPRWKTNLKMYCVSLPLVVVCMLGAFLIMLISFWAEEMLKSNVEVSSNFHMLPSIIYAGLIYVMNLAYRRFANFLTEWENHRTQSQFDRHRVTKLVLFEFVNNFMSLFYIAFVIQDMEMLRSQLATLLIILQLLNNFQESLLPLFLRYSVDKVSSITSIVKGKKKSKDLDNPNEDLGIPEMDSNSHFVQQAQREAVMDIYEDPYDDYLELFVQFGYVFLFSAIYPMAAFWSVINNVLEIRSDAFKLCCVYQRPMSRRVKDTGAWQRAFQALCAMSVLTNCGLLCLQPSLRALAPDMSPVEWVLLFVALEHVLLGTRQVLHYAIPDKPDWVRIQLARINYQSKQALKYKKRT
ncbi:anoctamin-10 isoform X2 [Nilaparvata lugens]|uniref:anoctamin-10 isoform X2 n=1 Tax=Nilaparvata lugens TaxID=108931 RepID=UPI00193EBB07|nr:anoctamin-10 isoform X2 [Nilaparvata lugens]